MNPNGTPSEAFPNPKIGTASIPVPVPVTNTYTSTFNITPNATAPATTPTDAQRPSSACVDPEARVTVMASKIGNGVVVDQTHTNTDNEETPCKTA